MAQTLHGAARRPIGRRAALWRTSSSKAIIAHMVGRDLDELFPRVPHTPGEPILELRELCRIA